MLDHAVMSADDYYEITAPTTPELFGYFSTSDNRWKSTNNPEGLRAKGVAVRKFVAVEE